MKIKEIGRWIWDKTIAHIFRWSQVSIIFALGNFFMIMTLWVREFLSVSVWVIAPFATVGLFIFSYVLVEDLMFVKKLSDKQKVNWNWYGDIMNGQKEIEKKLDRLLEGK